MINKLKIPLLLKEKRFCFVMVFFLSLTFSSPVNGQLYSRHEENFAFEVKQIDEFFERFNNERTLIKNYIFDHYDRFEVSREDLLKSLFDQKNSHFQEEEVSRFIQKVNDPENPVTLSFYDDNWYARVKCSVVYEKKERTLNLLLQVQKEQNGASKWVVQQVYADFLNTPNGNNPNAFLNPISHATDFMALNKAFEDPENLKAYLSSSFQDDQLSKFAIEMQNNRIAFRQVESVSYHFLQVDGWIFTVENFQRQEKNSGWLISSLSKADAEEKEKYKQQLLRQEP